jgi:alkanesulfonate monooxygenase SsuD/methylene tetrahydromethanopterin reductase-like flavin-dependent oxidoreductase (luciferase family)
VVYRPTARVLTVLELLPAHDRMTGAELVRRLEVDIRTVRKMISGRRSISSGCAMAMRLIWAQGQVPSPCGLRRMVETFAQACAEVGRDGATVRRSWSGGCACAPTQVEAEAIAGDLYSAQNQEDDFGFVGTPQQIVAQMRPFVARGVDSFLLDCGGFPNLTTLELLVHEVLPLVAKETTP